MTAETTPRWRPVPGTLARHDGIEVYVVAVNSGWAWVRSFLETDMAGSIVHVGELTPFTGRAS